MTQVTTPPADTALASISSQPVLITFALQVRTHAQKYFLKLAKIRSGARNGQVWTGVRDELGLWCLADFIVAYC